MKRSLRVLTLVLLLALLMGTGAEAITLYDNKSEAESVFMWEVPVEAGYEYQFSFSYWIDTDFVSDGTFGQIHDLFYFGVLNQDFVPIFDNNPSDVTGPVLTWTASGPFRIQPSSTDMSLLPLFSAVNYTEDFNLTVHIDDYSLEKVAAPVPEPSSALLFAAGLLGIYAYRRRR